MTGGSARSLVLQATTGASEWPMRLETRDGPLAYTLRRSPRARRLRVVIDPRRGVVVTVPGSRRGRATDRDVDLVEGFLLERERWVRRHLERHARQRADLAKSGPLGDGATLLYRGELHLIRIRPAGAAHRRSTVTRVGAEDSDELIVSLAARDRRTLAAVLRDWLRDRARVTIEHEIERHAPGLGVSPAAVTLRDPRTRWGSAARTRRLSFSWRLVLAPPGALETVVVHELAHLRIFGHGPDFWELVASRKADHRLWRAWLRDHSAELHAGLDEESGAAG